MRGLLQKDDDEDDEDADHGLFRHLAGRTQRCGLGRFELLARRPSSSPGLALHQRAASEMRFHIQIMRGLEPRKQLAQPARRLRSKVAHWRSPSFSITTTKRIGLQCQISTKTRSLLYPDIKPEPGGEQLRNTILKSAANRRNPAALSNRQHVLRFMIDNNPGKQKIRMAKVKGSGCFRTRLHAEAWCRISSYLTSMTALGYNPLVAIQIALAGNAADMIKMHNTNTPNPPLRRGEQIPFASMLRLGASGSSINHRTRTVWSD